MAAIVTHDAFGLPGRSRGVKNVQRIGCVYDHALVRARSGNGLVPVDIAAANQLCPLLGTLQDDAKVRCMRRQLNCLIEQRFVGNNTVWFDAAGRRDNCFRFGIIDAHSKFVCGETAEHHRMNSTDSRAGQNGYYCLGNHRHIDDDAITLTDAVGSKDAREQRGFIS